MRLFVAIELPDALRDLLARLQDDLTAGRPTDPETLHLTLAFLGEIDADETEDLHVALSALRARPFDVRLQGLDTFGGATPAVLFAGVEDGAPVADLHRQVRRAVRQAGMVLRRERFRPHVTLARFRRRMSPQDLDRLRLFLARNGGFAAPAFTVRDVTLVQSRLRPDGAVHEVLARYPLG